ncbi:MAG: Adenylosuccinate synthetase [Candidatus Heimdallarchaeota archaeon LC_3]|nr:MAG: Adenylosuccinate synthetase [Candidatus Heimdallarchaeota archaeon LC_3]
MIFLVGKGIVVIGMAYGDEGKGKIVDYYCSKHYIDAVVRFNGGSNAGHTIVAENKRYALHLLPSGMVYGKTSLIGNGVVVNPQKLEEELKQFPDKIKNLKIDPRSHIVLPIHVKLDSYQETTKKEGKTSAGTTKQGVGPCYSDKASRIGIRWADIEVDEIFQSQLNYIYKYYSHLKDILDLPPKDSLRNEIKNYYKKFEQNFVDGGEFLENILLNNRNILFEGAQSTLLDIDHGVYPFNTSSTCLVSGASSGTGIGIKYLNERIGVMKAYTSRVGEGPFVSELDTSENPGKYIQEIGAEYGTTTGRPRRVGWLDLVSMKYSVRLNSLTGLAITKLDVIGGLETFKVVVGYINDKGEDTKIIPPSVLKIKNYQSIYKEFEGWGILSKNQWLTICQKGKDSLPKSLLDFISFIEKYLKCPFYLLSFGPDRELTLELDNIESELPQPEG